MSTIREQLDAYKASTGPRKKGFRLSSTIDTSRLSSLGIGARCCKLSLMGLSIFLILSAIAILAGGAYAMNNLEIIAAIGPDFTNSILAFGVILLIIGSLGLAGSMKENRMVLACFLLVMGIMMLVLLIFGAWAVSNEGKEAEVMSTAWRAFSEEQKRTIANAYYCCGAYYWGVAVDDAEHNCPCTADQCGGCFPPMIEDYRRLYTSFGAVFIILSGIMAATIVTAYCLMSGVAKAQQSKKSTKRQGR